MAYFKATQSTIEFPATNAITGAAVTGLTITATIYLDGTSNGASTNSVTEIGTSGWYKLTLISAEMNAETVGIQFSTATANVFIDRYIIKTEPTVATIQSGLATSSGLTSAVSTLATSTNVTNAVSTLVSELQTDLSNLSAQMASTTDVATIESMISAIPTADLSGLQTKIDAIKIKTDSIGASQYTISSPVVDGQDLVIWAGMDYVNDAAITITKTGYSGLSLVGAGAVLRLISPAHYQQADDTADYDLACSLTISGDTTINVTVEIPAYTVEYGQYHYQVIATTASEYDARLVVLIDGDCTVTKTLE